MKDTTLEQEIKEICLRLLTRREHSQLELLNKLGLKGYQQTESASIIAELAEQGLQSDQRFAESYTRYRISNGFGPIKIRFELMQRGVEDFDLNGIVSELAEDWYEILERIYNNKYSDETMLNQKELQKRYRFLQQRGFSSQMVKKLFDRLNIQIIYGQQGC